MSKEELIGKIAYLTMFILGSILLVASFTTLYFYDAEANSIKRLANNTIEVEDGNKGYRVYSKQSCENLDINIYYESIMNMGDLIWDDS